MQEKKISKLIAGLEKALDDLKNDVIDNCLCKTCSNKDCKGLATGNYFIRPEFIVLKCDGYQKD